MVTQQAQQTEAQQIMANLDKAAELARTGKMTFYTDHDRRHGMSMFYQGLAGGTRGVPYLNVYAYYWYLNEKVVTHLKEPGFFTREEMQTIKADMIKINQQVERKINADAWLFHKKYREYMAGQYPDAPALHAAIQKLTPATLVKTREIWTVIDRPMSATGEKEKDTVRSFLKQPRPYGPLAELYQRELIDMIMDPRGEVQRATARLNPEDRDQIIFTDAQKKEITAWIRDGAAINDETYAKFIKVARGLVSLPARQVMRTTSFDPVCRSMVMLTALRTGPDQSASWYADAVDFQRVKSWVDWTYGWAGVPRKVK